MLCINALRCQKAPGLTNVFKKKLLTELISKSFPCPEKSYQACVCQWVQRSATVTLITDNGWVEMGATKKEKLMSNILNQSVWMYRVTWFWKLLISAQMFSLGSFAANRMHSRLCHSCEQYEYF